MKPSRDRPFASLVVTLGLISGPFVPAASRAAIEGHFDAARLRDESTLATSVNRDETRPSVARPQRTVRVLELEFTSQQWQGTEWRHPARIYLPADYRGNGDAGIIATHRGFFADSNSRRDIPGTDLGSEAEYAEGTALDLGIPIMIFASPAADYLGYDESDLMGFAQRKMAETGDPSWNAYFAITRSYLRAITLLHSLPGIKTERAVLLGCSKRGYAVAAATGVDPERVAGIVSTCYFGGDILYWIAMKFAQFGPDVAGPQRQALGPGYQPASALLESYNNPRGLASLLDSDPYLWRERIRSSFLVALGTNDPFYALGTPNAMMKALEADKAFVAIDNVGHTWVSEKHLAAWRMWLAHVFFDRPVATVAVEQREEGDGLAVVATVHGSGAIQAVRLFTAYNAGTDWRSARWSAVPMQRHEQGWSARAPRREGEKLAFYVEVEDSGRGGPGFVTSLVEIVD